MQVSCEKCGAEYQVDERRLPPAGLKMRCPKCAHTFVVKRPDSPQSVPPAPRAAPVPPAAPAAPKALAPRSPDAEMDFGDLDLPGRSVRPSTSPFASAVVPPPVAPSAAGASGPFGDLDLPIPAPKHAAKPAPKTSPASAFGDLDLPALAPPRGAAGAELPVPKATKGGMFDLDLPRSAPPAARPAGGFGDLDLPAPKASGPTAGRSAPAPMTDLPAPMTDLPVPKRAGVSPAGKQSVFDDLDLPLPSSPPDLPVPKGAAGPMRQTHGTAATTMQGSLSDLDLPVPRDDVDLPMPGVVAPSSEAQARAASKRAAAGNLDLPDDLPLPKRDLDLPVPARAKAHAGEIADLPIAKRDADLPIPKREDATDYGELDLSADNDDVGTAQELDLLAPRGDMSGRGGELVGGVQVQADEVVVDRSQRSSAIPAAPRERARRRQRSKLGQLIAISALGLVVLIGVGLSWTPFGMFGSTYIAELLPRSGQEELGATYVRNVRAYLKNDNYADYRQALGELRNGRTRAPTDQDLRAYSAYVAFLRVIRYGPDPASERRGGQLLVPLDVDNNESRLVRLAAAAREVARNKLPRAAARLQALVQADANDADALSLLGWTQLLQGQLAQAEATYGALLGAEPASGRAHFGLVRAALAKGELGAARARIAAALAVTPNHVGVLLERAKLMWTADGKGVAASLAAADVLARRRSLASPVEQAQAHSLIGEIALAGNRYGTARQQFEAALQRDERLEGALVGLGTVLYRQGQFAEALSRFEVAQRMNSDNVDAVIGAAMSLIAVDRLIDAKSLLQPLTTAENPDPRLRYWLAKTHDELTDLRSAEAELRAALGAQPGYTEASIYLASLLAREGKADEAAQLLAAARANAADTAEAHTVLGAGFQDRGELDDSERELRRALTLDQDYVPARFLLGSVLRRRGQVSEARTNLEIVAQRDSSYPGLSLERGRLYESSGDAPQALAMYREALRSSPNDVELKLRVGATSVLTGDYEGARAVLEQVLQARPNSPEALYAIGRVRFANGEHIEASSMFQRAVDLDASVAVYHLYFGWVSDVTNNIGRALEELNQAVALEPTLAEAYWRRGLVHLRVGAPRDAKTDLDKALELKPSLHQAYAALGDALDQLRDTPGAIRAYRQAISSEDGVGHWHYRLGELLLDEAIAREAVAELDRAVTLGAQESPRPAWVPDAYRGLGSALIQSGQRARAIEALQRFLEIAPPDSLDRSEALRELQELGAQ